MCRIHHIIFTSKIVQHFNPILQSPRVLQIAFQILVFWWLSSLIIKFDHCSAIWNEKRGTFVFGCVLEFFLSNNFETECCFVHLQHYCIELRLFPLKLRRNFVSGAFYFFPTQNQVPKLLIGISRDLNPFSSGILLLSNQKLPAFLTLFFKNLIAQKFWSKYGLHGVLEALRKSIWTTKKQFNKIFKTFSSRKS